MPDREQVGDLIQAHGGAQAVRRAGAQRLAQSRHVRLGEPRHHRESGIGRRSLLIRQARFQGLDVGAAHHAGDLTRGNSIFKSNTHERTHQLGEDAQNGFLLSDGLIHLDILIVVT